MTLAKAIMYATEKHFGQQRKFMQVPFIDHPLRVMHHVATDPVCGGNDILASIAVCHDVVEDCCGNTDEERLVICTEMGDLLGSAVVQGVLELTDEYTKERHPDKNRDKRKTLEHKRLSNISDSGKVIKLWDRFVNLEDTIKCAAETKKFTLLFAKESWDLAFALASPENAHISGRVIALAGQLRDMVNADVRKGEE